MSVATIVYNGFDFGDDASIDGFEIRPILDPAGRVLAYSEYTLTLHGYAFATNPNSDDPTQNVTDVQTAAIRRVLMQPAGALTVVNAGLGNFNIQTTLADVRYGPKPLSIKFDQLGSGAAIGVTFKVMVSIAGECNTSVLGVGAVKGPLYFNYELKYAIDSPGRYTKRTYTAVLRVAGIRPNPTSTVLADQADRLREQITPVVPVGFERLTDEWALSQDKLDLTGTIVDSQLPVQNYPPPGVVRCTASASSQSQGSVATRWTNSLEASYEMAVGVPRARAVQLFYKLLQDRMIAATKGNINPSSGGAHAMAPKLNGITFKEPNIYSRGFSGSFSASWWYMTSFAGSFRANGLWRPVPGSNWNTWFASVASVMGPRGHAGLMFNASDDVLLSPCLPAKPLPGVVAASGTISSGTTTGGGGSHVVYSPTEEETSGLSPAMLGQLGLAPSVTDPALSWLSYDTEVLVEPVDDVAELKLLPSAPVVASPSPTNEDDTTGYKVRYVNPGVPTSIIQKRAWPSAYITLRGRAIRAGYEITPPELLKVAGVTPIPANREGVNFFRSRVAGFISGPLVTAEWSLRWIMSGVPTAPILTPDNPLYGPPTVAQSGPLAAGGFITTTDL